MKKQLVIIGIVALLVTVGLSGCVNESPFSRDIP
jgi:outer membrane lipoprotein SlyB